MSGKKRPISDREARKVLREILRESLKPCACKKLIPESDSDDLDEISLHVSRCVDQLTDEQREWLAHHKCDKVRADQVVSMQTRLLAKHPLLSPAIEENEISDHGRPRSEYERYLEERIDLFRAVMQELWRHRVGLEDGAKETNKILGLTRRARDEELRRDAHNIRKGRPGIKINAALKEIRGLTGADGTVKWKHALTRKQIPNHERYVSDSTITRAIKALWVTR